MKRSRKIGCLVVLAIPAVALLYRHVPWPGEPYYPPAVAFEGDSKDLQATVIIPTLDAPLPEHQNVVWCGTMQLAWNRLGTDLLHGPPDLEGADAVVKRLNAAPLRDDDLAPQSFFATAGYVKDGIIDQIQKGMQSQFQREVRLESPKEADAIIAYSYLQSHIAFSIPFFENDESLTFTDSSGKETVVSSFGIRQKDEYAYRELRDQVEVIYIGGNGGNLMRPSEFILDLCHSSTPNQLIVACVAPRPTLAETIEDVNQRIREYGEKLSKQHLIDRRTLGTIDVLLVPNMNWMIDHRFSELEGPEHSIKNPGFEGNYVDTAAQMIRFQLDRSGAELASEAKLRCKPMPTFFVFNRPFLLFMRKRGQEQPFFALWIDNAELLSKPNAQ
jgi:hypothetical protein